MKYMNKIKQLISLPIIIAMLVVSVPFAPKAEASIDTWIRSVSIQPFSMTDFASSDMRETMAKAKADGANYVTLIIPYYQANRTSTDMYPSWNTPTDEALISAIDAAHSLGLHVMLKPHLETDYIEWRGNINPAPQDRPAWFESYKKMLIHYGQIAEQHGVEDYCIGAELFPMTNPSYDQNNTAHWQEIIKDLRGIYSGKLTYSANRDGEYDAIQFWPDLDYIGLSAYYNLYHAQNSSPEEQEKSWDAWRKGAIEPIQKKWNMPVVITEIGFRSIDGSYQAPWDWSRSGNFNEVDQANSYTAMFDYWKDVPWMQGIVLWRWAINPNGGGQGDIDYTPQNKAAEQVMQEFWGGGGDPVITQKPTLSLTTTITPSEIHVNEKGTITVTVANSGGALSDAIVDIETYKNDGTRLQQKFFTGQSFEESGTNSYTNEFTPTTEGAYHVEVGVFNNNWTRNYIWNGNAASVNVVPAGTDTGNATSTPPGNDTGTTTPPDTTTPPPTSTTTPPTDTGSNPPVNTGTPILQIITPEDGAHVTGTIPFGALLENRNIRDYAMSWQVDGDRLNPMYNTAEGGVHKEAMIDFTNWNWRPTGEAYIINFVAEDGVSHTTIQRSINIYPNQ